MGIALAGIDIAAWDTLADAAGQPLAHVLGANLVPVRAYGWLGLGLIGAERARRSRKALVAPDGFTAKSKSSSALRYRHRPRGRAR